MAIASKGEIARNMGVRLGAGACNILNSFREASNEYEDYYANKENKSVADYVMKAANTIGRGGARIIAGAGRIAGEALRSEPARKIKSGIMNAYDAIREKYSDYLNKSSDQLEGEMSRKELEGGGAGFGLKFQSFLNSAAKAVDKAYSKGEDIVKNTAKGLGDVARGIRNSEAYRNLASAAGKAENSAEKDINEQSK